MRLMREARGVASRSMGLVILVGVALGGAGCATHQTSEGDRKPPVEVSDHTTDDDDNSLERSVRPSADVDIERGQLIGVDWTSYEARIREGAVRCYRKRLRRADSDPEGTMVYEVLVTRNGRVASTDVVSSEMREPTFESCLEHVLSDLRFNIPSSRRPVYRLFFRLNFYLETLIPEEPPV